MDIASFLNWLRLKDADSNLRKREIFEKQCQGVNLQLCFSIFNRFNDFSIPNAVRNWSVISELLAYKRQNFPNFVALLRSDFSSMKIDLGKVFLRRKKKHLSNRHLAQMIFQFFILSFLASQKRKTFSKIENLTVFTTVLDLEGWGSKIFHFDRTSSWLLRTGRASDNHKRVLDLSRLQVVEKAHFLRYQPWLHYFLLRLKAPYADKCEGKLDKRFTWNFNLDEPVKCLGIVDSRYKDHLEFHTVGPFNENCSFWFHCVN